MISNLCQLPLHISMIMVQEFQDRLKVNSVCVDGVYIVVKGIYISGKGHGLKSHLFLANKQIASEIVDGTYCLTFAKTGAKVSSYPAIIQVTDLVQNRTSVKRIIAQYGFSFLPPIVEVLEEDTLFLKHLSYLQHHWQAYEHLVAKYYDANAVEKKCYLQEAVVLMNLLNFSYREIASALGISKSTVQRYLKRESEYRAQFGVLAPYLKLAGHKLINNSKMTTKELYRILKANGYEGSYPRLAVHVRHLKEVLVESGLIGIK